MMLDLLDMFSQPELAHAGLERMMDEEAARHLAAGQVPPLEQRRANMAAEVISASRARNETARDTFKSSLEQCKKLGSSLTPEDRESINLLNRFSEISREASSNRELFSAMPCVLDREERNTLERTPSFLLIAPILEDVHYRYQGEESFEKGNLSKQKRQLLTIQTAAIKLEAETARDEILCQAVSGERYMPMTIDAERFQKFVVNSQEAILKVQEALSLPPSRQEQALKSAFLIIATNYFTEVGKKLPGIPTEMFLEEMCAQFGGEKIRHHPITIILSNTDRFTKARVIFIEGLGFQFSRLAVEIGTKNLLSQNKPGLPTESAHGQTDAFSSAPPSQKQAAALLHNLFFALASAEEVMNFKECQEKFGNNIPSSAIRPMADQAYRGSSTIGDEVNADQKLSQRVSYSERFALSLKSTVKKLESSGIEVRLTKQSDQNTEDSKIQDTHLLLDESLIKWAASSDARHLLHGLNNPMDRLRIAQIATVDAALLRVLPF